MQAAATVTVTVTSAARVSAIAPKSSMRQVVLQWSLGMWVATPLIAIIQGTYHLSQYRSNHGDAPRPAMPARGVAVVVEEQGVRPHTTLRLNDTQKPLRLLVVGDSLAAGVGMSKSGTPVLPESIARALSKACGGRAVYWTCVGTPGVSASQIVQDIHQLEPHQPGRLEQLLREWQIKRRKWQERREKIRRRLTDLESTDDSDDLERQPIRNYLKDWWELIRTDTNRSPRKMQETTTRMVQEWWSQVTTRFQATKQRVEEDLTEIQEIVRSVPEEEDEGKTKNIKDALIRQGTVFHRDSIDPEAVAEYDIAVVLTGLNDLKDAFMPHMTAGAKSSLKEGTERMVGGLRSQLKGVLGALEEKMDLETHREEAVNELILQNLRRPLVVVPELPIAPVKLFHLVPLSWFLIPLFRAMENNKKFLSSCFPDYVVFIPQPDLQWWSDVEAGLGPIRDNIRQEQLLLRSTDITKTVKERIQYLMKQHYYPDEDDENTDPDYTGLRHRDRAIVPSNRTNKGSTDNHSGSPFVAMDKLHPNDEGYELWGRHIAAAIVAHWDR